LNQETWFGCIYARIAFLNNMGASCSPELMVHSKCFARSKTMHMKLILHVHMVWVRVSMLPIYLHSLDWKSQGWLLFKTGRMMRTSQPCTLAQVQKTQIKGHLHEVAPRNYRNRWIHS
jgi:hypothetical protein